MTQANHASLYDEPAYRAAEAAQMLALPAGTLKAWGFGQDHRLVDGRRKQFRALIDPADRTGKLLSFNNLCELHTLAAIRRGARRLRRSTAARRRPADGAVQAQARPAPDHLRDGRSHRPPARAVAGRAPGTARRRGRDPPLLGRLTSGSEAERLSLLEALDEPLIESPALRNCIGASLRRLNRAAAAGRS